VIRLIRPRDTARGVAEADIERSLSMAATTGSNAQQREQLLPYPLAILEMMQKPDVD
jgi:hypothetical protein